MTRHIGQYRLIASHGKKMINLVTYFCPKFIIQICYEFRLFLFILPPQARTSYLWTPKDMGAWAWTCIGQDVLHIREDGVLEMVMTGGCL
jgi:hypothetical protein